MSVSKFRYALVLLAFTREFLLIDCKLDTTTTTTTTTEQLEMSKKDYQLLLNEQIDKSSDEKKESVVLFVTKTTDRNKRDVTTKEFLSNKDETEKEIETSIEKPQTTQIRHGRSRSHFVRQIKLEDLESSLRIRTKRIQHLSSNYSDTEIDKNEDSNYSRRYESRDAKENILQETTKKDRLSYVDDTPETLTESTVHLNDLIRKVFRQHANVPAHVKEEEEEEAGGGLLLNKFRKKNKNKMNDPYDSTENTIIAYGRVLHTSVNNEESLKVNTNENQFKASVSFEEEFDNTLSDRRIVGNSSSMNKDNDYDDNESFTTDFIETDDNDEDDDNEGEDVLPTKRYPEKESVQVDIVTRFLRIIENQHLLGENCTAGTDLNLGEGVVDRYAQERFRLEANLAVNRANMLTRLWKYAPDVMLSSEYLLHASVLSMVEFDEDIFAAGNCYDKLQYKDHWLYCPFAHRLPDQEGVLVKDLAIEYKYLSNSSEWFYIARKNAERVIASNNTFSRGLHTYVYNESTHTEREEDEILTVKYEDGRWSKPYYDCGGGNIWMLTYTVPFFGYVNDTYFFKGTSGIDIDLRRVDIDQCPLPPESNQLNIFAASDKCKKRTTKCVAIPGLGFRRGSYRCVCKRGFYYPDTKSTKRYYNGTVIEEEYEKLMMGEESQYAVEDSFECLPCAEGCESCVDGSACVVSLNWLMRTAILILECCVIACLPAVALFTWKYGNVKIVRAASPVLLRVIVLGAFFIYCTTIVMYPQPNVITCTVRVWLREIGFSLTYGALMLKTWRISVIFRVKSAKAVKITDASLLKRLGIIVMIFSVFLSIRTLVAPPVVIVARTADDLKAYLCRTDWWDHSFTTLEVMFLIWGIRLCIVVRKTPSEFNESRFISMAIYNEFLLSVFLNVSMLFLQSPANPDLLYIIFFCHTQLTVTLLLCLIFGSKAYVVFRGYGKEDSAGKLTGPATKFISKSSRPQGTSNQTNSISLQQGNFTEESDGSTEEFYRLIAQLDVLKEKNVLLGNHYLVNKIVAMQEAANRNEAQVSTIQTISTSIRLNDLNGSRTFVESEAGGVSCEKEHKREGMEQHEKKCQACIEKNGLRSKDQHRNSYPSSSSSTSIRKGEHSDLRETDKEVHISSNDGKNDVGVSTSSKLIVTSEDIATETNPEPNGKEHDAKDKFKSKSGHARTHAIVINLDDKSRFSEEVTV
ncbi:PREDICTED: probable G-protein coupled receptor 158 [Polistes dominula]|uniref:Probable G-protein coupled receptor 158 n=1 Tax=Polistes dominula TaxID=743375 RepID=A0ABM1IT36_POLDO|nr:PREDICTED: probable G-protein coupled receptor 158 [Polistes dominula]XP_015183374.1 PREDICTED: probable G-protein coupled receptor 158 [Polistes dominula]